MKKKIIIGVSAAVVVALGVLYFYRAYLFGDDLSKYVPKNAAFVVKIDIMGMGKKLDVKGITESDDVKDLLKELPEKQRELIEKVIKDPKTSGLNIATSPIIFGYSNSDNSPITAVLLGISDKAKLKDFITKVSDDEIRIKDADSEGFYKVVEDRGGAIYFNSNIAVILVDVNRKDINFKKERDKIAKMEKANSILSNEEYATINKQTNDIMVYLNKTELPTYYKNANPYGSIEEAEMIKTGMKFYPYAYTVNFIEDAISFKTFSSNDKDAPAILREGGLTENELKNLAPNGSPLAYFTLNMDFKKIIDLGYAIAKQIPGNPLNNGVDPIETLAAELQVPKADLLNIFQGKMSVAFAGVKMVSKTDPYTLTTSNEPFPIINAWVSLGNKEAAIKLLEQAVTNGTLVNNGGIYSENAVSYDYYNTDIYAETPAMPDTTAMPTANANAKYFVAIKGNDLIFSTDANAINSKMQGGADWTSLNAELGKSNASAKPVSFFVDLRYKNIESLVSNINPSSTYELEKYKSVLSQFKEISGYGDNKGSEMILKFTEEKKNSLQRIVDIAKKAAKLSR